MIAVVFVLTRAAAAVAGVRFDATPLDFFWQYAPENLLRHDFVRTIWWFHAQPPAFNVFLGAVLQLPDGLRVPVFAAAFLLCGLVIAVGGYLLAVELGVGRGVAAGVTLVVACSPAALVYENQLFYPYPVAALLITTFGAFAWYLRTGRTVAAVVLCGTSASLVLTRASFHLVWFVALVVAAWAARPDTRRRLLAVAALPLLVVGGWYVKNWVQFDTFSSSSWLGMNFARVVRNDVPPAELPGILQTPPFSAPEAYGADKRPPTGVAVLDQRRKVEGEPNYNHIVYLDASAEYLDEALTYTREHPGEYLRAVGTSLRLYFAPPTDQPVVQSNLWEISDYDRLYNRVVGWQPRHYYFPLPGAPDADRYAPDALDVSWSSIVAYAIALAALPLTIVRRWRARIGDPVRVWTIAVASATVWASIATGTLLELGENSRYRVETDMLVAVLAAALLSVVLRRLRTPSITATAPTAASTASDGSAAARNLV